MGKITQFLNVLTEGEVEKLHEESLKVLETVGLRVPHSGVLALCRKAGFTVDEIAQRVRFPYALTEALLRQNKPDAPEPEGPVDRVFGGISTQVFIVDYPGDVRRQGTLKDVRRGLRVSDRLDNIRESNAVVIPADIPYNLTDIASLRELYLYSTKPGATYILTPESGRGIIEMGRVMDTKPSYLLETVSPLGYMNSSLETALIFAQEGNPITTGPMVIAGATGPMSLWGTLVLELAEVTGTNLIIYALTGSFHNFVCFGCHTMDMQTTLCSFGSPNQAVMGMVAGQMGRYYGWGSGSNSALSDACLPDYQYGMEKAFNGLMAILSGTERIGAQGIVGADQGIGLEQLVLDNDWLDAYRHVMKGLPYDPDALKLIEEIGIAGNYIAEEHTVEHMREVYWRAPSRTFWRDQWGPWRQANTPDIYARAHDFVRHATAGCETMDPVVDPARAEEIDRIYRETVRRVRATSE